VYCEVLQCRTNKQGECKAPTIEIAVNRVCRGYKIPAQLSDFIKKAKAGKITVDIPPIEYKEV